MFAALLHRSEPRKVGLGSFPTSGLLPGLRGPDFGILRSWFLASLLDHPPVERLNRASVVGIKPSECPDLLSRYCDRLLQNQPGDPFGARRSGYRSRIHVVPGRIS